MQKMLLCRFVFSLMCVLAILALAVASTWAWQSAIVYGHTARFGGEAESGYHRGQVEFSGGKRYARAGDDYVYWTAGQIAWITANASSSKRPALVYHAFAPTTNSCNAIRVTSWSWSNLPGWSAYYKGCGAGRDNEVRFLIYSYGALTAGTYYYIQHLFEDTDYPGTYTHGQITTDSYWDVGWYHWGQYKDYHTKFCVGHYSTSNPPPSGICP